MENGHPLDNGGGGGEYGGDGWVFIELHPFDFRNIRLIGDGQPQVRHARPTEIVRGSLIIMAPLYEYVVNNGGEQVKVDPADPTLFHNTADMMNGFSLFLETGNGKPIGTAYYRETVVRNGTGQPLDMIRTVARDQFFPTGITVSASVTAPIAQTYNGVQIADIDDPANDRSILLVEYHLSSTPLTGGLLRHTIRSAAGWQPVGDVNDQISDPPVDVIQQAGLSGTVCGGPGWVVAVGAAMPEHDVAQFMLGTDSGRLWVCLRKADGTWTKTGTTAGSIPVGYGGPPVAIAGVGTQPFTTQWMIATADGHLWHTVASGIAGWQPISDASAAIGLDGRATALAAACASPDESQFMIITQDGHLWHTILHPDGSWQAVGDATGAIGLKGDAAAVAGTSPAAGEAQFIIVTQDGHVWHTIRHLDGSWQGVGDATAAAGLKGNAIAVAAASPMVGDAEFMIVTDDGHLWQTVRHANEAWDPVADVTAKIGGPAEPVMGVAAVSTSGGTTQFLLMT